MTENRNKINKVLQNGTVKDLTFRNNFDVENPIIYLSFDPIASGFNYVEIHNKYYFIDCYYYNGSVCLQAYKYEKYVVGSGRVRLCIFFVNSDGFVYRKICWV